MTQDAVKILVIGNENDKGKKIYAEIVKISGVQVELVEEMFMKCAIPKLDYKVVVVCLHVLDLRVDYEIDIFKKLGGLAEQTLVMVYDPWLHKSYHIIIEKAKAGAYDLFDSQLALVEKVRQSI